MQKQNSLKKLKIPNFFSAQTLQKSPQIIQKFSKFPKFKISTEALFKGFFVRVGGSIEDFRGKIVGHFCIFLRTFLFYLFKGYKCI